MSADPKLLFLQRRLLCAEQRRVGQQLLDNERQLLLAMRTKFGLPEVGKIVVHEGHQLMVRGYRVDYYEDFDFDDQTRQQPVRPYLVMHASERLKITEGFKKSSREYRFSGNIFTVPA